MRLFERHARRGAAAPQPTRAPLVVGAMGLLLCIAGLCGGGCPVLIAKRLYAGEVSSKDQIYVKIDGPPNRHKGTEFPSLPACLLTYTTRQSFDTVWVWVWWVRVHAGDLPRWMLGWAEAFIGRLGMMVGKNDWDE